MTTTTYMLQKYMYMTVPKKHIKNKVYITKCAKQDK